MAVTVWAAVFILFFLFREGPSLSDRLGALMPLSKHQVARLYRGISDAILANVYGGIAVAIAIVLPGILPGYGASGVITIDTSGAARQVRGRCRKTFSERPARPLGEMRFPPSGGSAGFGGALSAEGDLARIRRARALGFEGDPCGACGNFTLVRNGTCMKCDTCGSTTGCS